MMNIQNIRNIHLKTNSFSIKFWYGNPNISIHEGVVIITEFNYYTESSSLNINQTQSYKITDFNELSSNKIKEYIWNINIENTLISTNMLLCKVLNKISISEFIYIIETYIDYIYHIRVLKSHSNLDYYIYIEFKSSDYTNLFFNAMNLKRVSPFDDEYLSFMMVNQGFSFINNENDIDNKDHIGCSICLDNKTTGIVYGLCNHSFHIQCLLKASVVLCPLCRYLLSPDNYVTCKLCFVSNDLWRCLICGVSHCGEDKESNNHRYDHYLNTKHRQCKSILEKQTYDFELSMYLEVYLKKQITSQVNLINTNSNSNSNNNDNTVNEEINEKDYIVSYFNSILSSQLESQRNYYITLIKQTEESYLNTFLPLSNEIQKINQIEKEENLKLEETKKRKEDLFELTSKLNSELKILNDMVKIEEEFLNGRMKIRDEMRNEIKSKCNKGSIEEKDIDESILRLKNEIEEMRLNINLKKKIKKENVEDIFGVIYEDNKGKKKRKK